MGDNADLALDSDWLYSKETIDTYRFTLEFMAEHAEVLAIMARM